MPIERWLTDQVILIVDGRSHLFIYDLQDALAGAGADVLLAHDVGTALTYIKRFDFEACVLGALPPEVHQRLVEELGGTPLLQLGDEPVPAIIAKLMRMLGKDDA